MKIIAGLGILSAVATPQAALVGHSDDVDSKIYGTIPTNTAVTSGDIDVKFDSSWGVDNTGSAETKFSGSITGDYIRRVLGDRFNNRDIQIEQISLKNIFKTVNSPGTVNKASISALSAEIVTNDNQKIDVIPQELHGDVKYFYKDGNVNPYGTAELKVNHAHNEVPYEDIKSIDISGSIWWSVTESSGDLFGDTTEVHLNGVDFGFEISGLPVFSTHEKSILPGGTVTINEHSKITTFENTTIVYSQSGKKHIAILESLYEDDDTVIFKPKNHIEVRFHKRKTEWEITNLSSINLRILEIISE